MRLGFVVDFCCCMVLGGFMVGSALMNWLNIAG